MKPIVAAWEAVRGTCWSGSALAGSAALVLSLPLLAFDFWFDQGVFATIADALLDGGVAYRDAWEHKPPGVFYVYAASFLLLGRDLWAIRCAEILALAATSAGLVELTRRHLGSRLPGVIGALLLPTLYLPFAPNTAQPESFQMAFLVWALVLWPGGVEDPAARRKAVVSGALFSVAVLFKTPAILLAALAVSAQLAADRKRAGWKGKLRLSGLLAAGLLAPAAILVAYYSLRGAFVPLWDALVVFPSRYAASTGGLAAWDHLRHLRGWALGAMSPAEIVLLTLGAGRCALRSGRGMLLAAALLAAWATVALQSRYFHYHWIPLLPFGCLAIGSAFMSRPRAPQEPFGRQRFAMLLVVCAVAAAALPGVGGRLSLMWQALGRVATIERPVPLPGIPTPWGESRKVAARIRALTGPEDRIFVWADEALLYLYSDRRMAGPYPHLMPMLAGWRGDAGVATVLERFAQEPPRLIVVGPGKLWWRQGQQPAYLLEVFPDMKGLLQDRYRRAESVSGFDLWLLLDGAGK